MTHRIDTDTAHRIWNRWIAMSSGSAHLLNPCDLIRMVEDEIHTQKMYSVCVHELCISNGTENDKIWIGDWVSGESGDFDKGKFRDVVQKFFKEHF